MPITETVVANIAHMTVGHFNMHGENETLNVLTPAAHGKQRNTRSRRQVVQYNTYISRCHDPR